MAQSCCAAEDREGKHAYLASIIESKLILDLDQHGMLLSGSMLTSWLVASGSDVLLVQLGCENDSKKRKLVSVLYSLRHSAPALAVQEHALAFHLAGIFCCGIRLFRGHSVG